MTESEHKAAWRESMEANRVKAIKAAFALGQRFKQGPTFTFIDGKSVLVGTPPKSGYI